MNIENLYDGNYADLKKVTHPDMHVEGYEYLQMKRGNAISIVPYRTYIDRDGEESYELLIRKEWTPAWMTSLDEEKRWVEPFYNSITGAIETGYTPDQTAVKELKEESGYEIAESKLIFLGTSFIHKAANTMCSLYSCDLTGYEAGSVSPDSKLESIESVMWVEMDRKFIIANVSDPLFYAILTRLFMII